MSRRERLHRIESTHRDTGSSYLVDLPDGQHRIPLLSAGRGAAMVDATRSARDTQRV